MDLEIRDQNLVPKKVLVLLVDLEFDVEYDFTIKHDPNLSDDWVVAFCVIPCWAPKEQSYIKWTATPQYVSVSFSNQYAIWRLQR